MNTEFDLQTRLEAAGTFSLVFTAGLLILNLGGVIMGSVDPRSNDGDCPFNVNYLEHEMSYSDYILLFLSAFTGMLAIQALVDGFNFNALLFILLGVAGFTASLALIFAGDDND